MNVTLMLQMPFGGTELGQLLVWAKSLLLGPVILIDLIVSVAAPVLVSVTRLGALEVPTFCCPKSSCSTVEGCRFHRSC